MQYELVSFKICPFVQRALITLLHKRVPHTVTYIDLHDPPAWFTEISPLGKVPILRVDGGAVLFESAVINEYIDETTPEPMHPSDPLQRALNRSWIEYASGLTTGHFKLITTETPLEYAAVQGRFVERLGRLEQVLGDGPFFNGARLSLVDTAYAPLFMRLALLAEVQAIIDPAHYPKIAAWSDALLALPEVSQSVVAEFPELYRKRVTAQPSYLGSLFEARRVRARA